MLSAQDSDAQSSNISRQSRVDLKPRTQVVLVILCYCSLLLVIGILDGATRYSPRWWMALGLGGGTVVGFVIGMGVGITLLLALLYGLIGLVQHFQNYPLEITIPWYIAVLGLVFAMPVLLGVLCGLMWVLRHEGILDKELNCVR
jgi:hypothetical protein